jgi:hypothetical protein
VKFVKRNGSERLPKTQEDEVFLVFEIEDNVIVFDIKECIFFTNLPLQDI